MTAIKATSQCRTILDFSSGKCSKNRIRQSLRTCDIISLEEKEKHRIIFYHNQIKVGMYYITLVLPFDSSEKWKKLRDYGDFEIVITDSDSPKISGLNLKRDPRFKDQYWAYKNTFGQLRIKHLIDIIAHCHRLNGLRAFL